MKFGLLGKKLGHSFSPEIHSHFGEYQYELFEREEEEIKKLIENKEIQGFNITIPYKKAMMKYCDEIEENAAKIGAVNTVVKKEGKVYGYNTDFSGFIYMLERAGIEIAGKKVAILGDGATSQTVEIALDFMGAKEVLKFSRKGEMKFEDLNLHKDIQVLINCTPVGMYPNNLEKLLNLSDLINLEGVADVIYNPHRTALLLEARRLGLRYTDGLPMLVLQAKFAAEYFTGKEIPDSKTEEVIRILRRKTENIVLIGMPGSGKTTIARVLAKKLNRKFIDTDKEIVKKTGKFIPEIFETMGEEAFREIETEIIEEFGKETGIVLATGGGSVLFDRNYDPLKQNGRIYFLNRDLKRLSVKGRPLSKGGFPVLEKMYQERLPLYEKFADSIIENRGISGTVDIIEEDFYENINH